jgi:hypothetical protein
MAHGLQQMPLLGRASVPVVVQHKVVRSLLMVLVPVAAARGIQRLQWWVVALPALMRTLQLSEEEGGLIWQCHGPNLLDFLKPALSTRFEALKFLCVACRFHLASHSSPL